MFDLISDFFLKTNLLLSLGFTSILFFLMILYSKKIHMILKISSYNAVQKIHNNSVHISREGGLCFFMGLSFFWFINYESLDAEFNRVFSYLILFPAPILFFAFIEDFYQNIPALVRLISIIFSAALFLIFQQYGYPKIDLPFLFFINDNEIILFILFVLCITVLCNGMNIIDGTNGLSSTNAIASLASISFLALISNDYLILYISLLLSMFLILFLLFNYPWGSIFLGDFGAYFCGWVISILLIILFSRNPTLPSWNAALIVFYPIFEVTFSYFRKILSAINPMKPDGKHLHLLLFFLLNRDLKRNKVANCLVLPFLSFFWLFPAMIIPWVYTHIELIIFCLIFLIIFYLSIYYFIKNG